MPPAAMQSVTGKRIRIPAETLEEGTLAGVKREWPRLPRRTLLSHNQYWEKNPWFK